MKLYGKLIKGTVITKEAFVEIDDENLTFREALEQCLISVCKKLDIQVPLWLNKNTNEFARFRKTFFSKEQFTEKVGFDKFDIRIE